MASPPPPNVKIYDRPERKGPSPLILAIVLILLLVIGYFVYKALHHPAPVAVHASFRPSSPARSWERLPGTGSHRGLPIASLSQVSANLSFTTKGTDHENHRWIV